MYARKVKRKCNVRGCKSTDCFAISRTREVGNTVIICKSCLEKALVAIDEIDPKSKSNIPAIDNTAVRPLFFNAKALGMTEKEVDDVPSADDATNADGASSPEDGTEFKCPVCGKTFDSSKGLRMHKKYCETNNNNE